MVTWETVERVLAVATALGTVGAAIFAYRSARAAEDSSRAASESAKGARAGGQIALEALGVAKDSAQSTADAVVEFRRQVEVGEKQVLVLRERLVNERALNAPQVVLWFKADMRARKASQVENIIIHGVNNSDRPVTLSGALIYENGIDEPHLVPLQFPPRFNPMSRGSEVELREVVRAIEDRFKGRPLSGRIAFRTGCGYVVDPVSDEAVAERVIKKAAGIWAD